MCGIAGVILPRQRAVATTVIADLSAALQHRGPDDHGFLGWRREQARPTLTRDVPALAGSEVAFIHRRLSIIDLTETGWQPMATPDGRYSIVYNGEIYNHRTLRADLEAEGAHFVSESDTEVLLQAVCRWGLDTTLSRLIGMFAFAILDVRAGTVTLARDPFGIKPLSYTCFDGGLAFASELPPLLALPGMRRRVDPQALYDYLRFGLTDRGDQTLFATVKHLPAAHYVVINVDCPQDLHPVRYWSPRNGAVSGISFEEAVTRLRQLFDESVGLHLRADVPVGALLSGGIDSSAIVMTMRHFDMRGRLDTFSFFAPGDAQNEQEWANIIVRAAQTKEHSVAIGAADLGADLDDLILTQGEPFGSPSVYAQNRVYQAVRAAGFKVVLDGQGADEILAGYTPFLAVRLASLLRRGDFGSAVSLLLGGRKTAGGILAMALRASRFILPQTVQPYARRLVGEGLLPGWIDANWFIRHGVTVRAPQEPISTDILRNQLQQSLMDTVLPALLRYQDRNSMAHSVESRVPFLTTALVDFLYSLPEEFLISSEGETKAVFRAAMRGRVPPSILGRRDKIGFATPTRHWLEGMGGMLNTVIKNDMPPMLRGNVLEAQLHKARTGGALAPHLWRGINLSRWSRQFGVEFAS